MTDDRRLGVVARLVVTTLLLALAAPARVAAETGAGARPWRVVVDPGHGGTEEGAIGAGGLKEKELTLDVATRLSELLRVAGFEVVLTRAADATLGLDARAEIANTGHADLFVSLHANASRFAKARGAETFFLAREATDDAARTVAALENDVAGAASQAAASGDSDLSLILWDMAQNEHLEASQKLAATVQSKLNAALGITDRGVRQAPFRVLVGATCPAVLVELGFITNPEEERLLATGEYRQKLAEALLTALVAHRDASGP